MHSTNWFYFSLALSTLQLTMGSREIFLRKNRMRASKIEAIRSASLARLLQYLAREYFDDCVLSLIYDSTYEQSHPVDFRTYFEKLNLSFTQESVDISKGEVLRERRLNKCTNYMLFLHDTEAIKHILARDVTNKIVLISAESAWEIKDFLKTDIARYYANLIVICHSTSRKSGIGAYLLYTNKLYADGSGASKPLLLASWLNTSLSRPKVNLFYDKLKGGFMGHRLLVSTTENPPFTIRRSRSSQDEMQWDGLEVRVLQLAASYLNFSVEFTEPITQLPASLEAVKADVSQGLASMAIGGIYRTVDLEDDFDATTPHYEDCASFISLASTALPKYRAVLGPFQLAVWVMLIIAYFSLIVPLSFNSKYTILSLIKHPSGLNNMFWFVFSTYTNSFIVKNPLLTEGIAKNTTTLLLGIYWVFTIIITACYTGSIVAFITLPVFPEAMEKAEDFAYYRYRIGTLDRNGWEKWFNVSAMEEPMLKKLFRKMELVPTLLEGVTNASRAYFWPYAFLASRTALDYLVQTDFAPDTSTKRSQMHISNECFVRFQVVQLFPPKSLYTEKMNSFVIRANEHGLLDRIITDIEWQVQRIAIMTGKKITKGLSQAVVLEDRVLAVEDTQGMFLILGSGVLMALLALSIENLNSRLRARNKPQPHPHPELIITDYESRKPSAIDAYWHNHYDEHHHSWLRPAVHVAISTLRFRHPRGSV